MKASRISILRNQLFCTGSCRPANPTGCWFPDEVSPQGAWWCLCESGDHEDSQTAQGIYGTVWRNAERWKKSHNDRHLYDELISYADLYDSANFEAKKIIVNQLIRRVDVYRGYQINISFNFDLTPYIEGEWYVCLQNSRASNKHFQKQRNSKNWGCRPCACKIRHLADFQCDLQESKKKSTELQTKYSAFLVENSGIEPLTSCMPCKRSPSWANPP